MKSEKRLTKDSFGESVKYLKLSWKMSNMVDIQLEVFNFGMHDRRTPTTTRTMISRKATIRSCIRVTTIIIVVVPRRLRKVGLKKGFRGFVTLKSFFMRKEKRFNLRYNIWVNTRKNICNKNIIFIKHTISNCLNVFINTDMTTNNKKRIYHLFDVKKICHNTFVFLGCFKRSLEFLDSGS